MTPKGPYKLVTVNNAPERAKRLIGRVVKELDDRYTIEHVANCERLDEVREVVAKLQPDILCCASMWSREQSDTIRAITKEEVPGIKTHAIPQGLQVERGPDAIVEHLVATLPDLIES